MRREELFGVWLCFAYFGVFGKSVTETFNDKELSNQRLKLFFIKSLLEWSRASLEMENPSI